jgi:hypothetical protein
MDEATRTIIAYAALLMGLPLLAARIVWFVPGVAAALILAPLIEGLDRFLSAVAEGFLALVFACLLFEHLGLEVAWKIPVILIIVHSLWSCTQSDTLNAFPSIVGIIAGFVFYPQALLFVSLKLGLDV